MKKFAILTILLILLSFPLTSCDGLIDSYETYTKIYITNNITEPGVLIAYRTNYRAQANLIAVVTRYRTEADYIVYFTDEISKAQKKIYIER